MCLSLWTNEVDETHVLKTERGFAAPRTRSHLHLTAKLPPPLLLPVALINAWGASAVVTTDRVDCRTGLSLSAVGSLQKATTMGQNLSEHVIAQILKR